MVNGEPGNTTILVKNLAQVPHGPLAADLLVWERSCLILKSTYDADKRWNTLTKVSLSGSRKGQAKGEVTASCRKHHLVFIFVVSMVGDRF